MKYENNIKDITNNPQMDEKSRGARLKRKRKIGKSESTYKLTASVDTAPIDTGLSLGVDIEQR